MVTDRALKCQEPSFSHKLQDRANRMCSWLCIGLDPDPDRLPGHLPRTTAGIVHFCRKIVEATGEYALGYKPNVAFFEALGPEGWTALHEIRACVPPGVPVIADAKRGDIGHTARAYGKAFFDVLGCDALTVNPYLGPDSLEPYMGHPGRCILVLTRTSNEGASVVQDRDIRGVPMYLAIARWAMDLDGPTEVGFVVGATQLSAIQNIRSDFPNALLLLPGVGVQGAGAHASAVAAAGDDGQQALISVSRQILYASSGRDFAEAAAREARALAAETWLG
ncbi:MAG: orotidine-5'-phosphate decarboxylase [Chloroflexi bacterium]|nr:MAG: orotidine-5'-phosphate decarboxylase [Chloroflexota bacterium]